MNIRTLKLKLQFHSQLLKKKKKLIILRFKHMSLSVTKRLTAQHAVGTQYLPRQLMVYSFQDGLHASSEVITL